MKRPNKQLRLTSDDDSISSFVGDAACRRSVIHNSKNEYKKKLKDLVKIVSVIFCLTILIGCRSNRVGGTIPVFMDEYVSTTEERRFEIKEVLTGHIIKYQKAYNCNNKDYKYNATAIVSVNSELLTIYDYCQQYSFKAGDRIRINPAKEQNLEWSTREILEPFPKSSNNHGYWQCVSCKFKNAFGSIELMN